MTGVADSNPHGGADLFILACDHRRQFVEIADGLGVSHDRLPPFKRLAVAAAARLKAAGENVGTICDGEYGTVALQDAETAGLWCARPIEVPGKKPLELVTGPDIDAGLRGWSEGQVVKCLCFFDVDDPRSVRQHQEDLLMAINQACLDAGREFLLEIIPSGAYHDRGKVVADIVKHLYHKGIRPDWWKLEPFEEVSDWESITKTVEERDPTCKGILILGLTSTEDTLQRSFEAASAYPAIRGFAVGRSIVEAPLRAWLKGDLGDEDATSAMEGTFSRLIDLWKSARSAPAMTGK